MAYRLIKENDTLYADVFMFGTSRRVLVTKTERVTDDLLYDKVIMIERHEDWYALNSLDNARLRIAIVTKENWELSGFRDTWKNGVDL